MKRTALWVAALVALLVLGARVRYTESDPQLTLLTAQALLAHGSVRLDPWARDPAPGHFAKGSWKHYRDPRTGHIYYVYPPALPLLALPATALARGLGLDMNRQADDARVQIALAAVVCACGFLLVEALARRFLPAPASLLAALALTLGSPLVSTLGTALWSHGPAALCLGLVLLHAVDVEHGRRASPAPVALGLLVALGFGCRPTVGVLFPSLAAWLWKRAGRQAVVRFAAASGLGLAAFAAWSLAQYGRLLPLYYSPGYWRGTGFDLGRLWDVLFSPSRGLFVFVPVLALGVLAFALPVVRRSDACRLAAATAGLLVVLVARQGNWWGGWCFGPRLLTEAVIPLAVPMFAAAATLRTQASRAWRGAALSLFAVATTWGVALHVRQGLFNPETHAWNGAPSIDDSGGQTARDWRYPQFFASRDQRLRRFSERLLAAEAGPLLSALPDDGVLLFGPPHPLVASILASWKESLARGSRIANDPDALLRQGIASFHAAPAWGHALAKRGYRVTIAVHSPLLGDYLEQQVRAGRDLWLAATPGPRRLSPRTADVIRAFGGQADDLASGEAWVARVTRGRVVAAARGRDEVWLPPMPLGAEHGALAVVRTAAGSARASLRSAGADIAPEDAGVVVMAFDEIGGLVERRVFDLSRGDGAGALLLAAVWQ